MRGVCGCVRAAAAGGQARERELSCVRALVRARGGMLGARGCGRGCAGRRGAVVALRAGVCARAGANVRTWACVCVCARAGGVRMRVDMAVCVKCGCLHTRV